MIYAVEYERGVEGGSVEDTLRAMVVTGGGGGGVDAPPTPWLAAWAGVPVGEQPSKLKPRETVTLSGQQPYCVSSHPGGGIGGVGKTAKIEKKKKKTFSQN